MRYDYYYAATDERGDVTGAWTQVDTEYDARMALGSCPCGGMIRRTWCGDDWPTEYSWCDRDCPTTYSWGRGWHDTPAEAVAAGRGVDPVIYGD